MTTIGRWSPNKVRAKIIDASWAAETRYALELIKPSSVVVDGGGSESATISALGSVDFANATSLSLNDVFSAGYDNYMVVYRGTCSASNYQDARLRASGSDASGSNYTVQSLAAYGTTVTGGRGTSQTSFQIMYADTAQRHGYSLFVYGPNLAQPTAMRSVSADSYLGAEITDYACTHSLSAAYDGLTLIPRTGNATGNVAVYGLRG